MRREGDQDDCILRPYQGPYTDNEPYYLLKLHQYNAGQGEWYLPAVCSHPN